MWYFCGSVVLLCIILLVFNYNKLHEIEQLNKTIYNLKQDAEEAKFKYVDQIRNLEETLQSLQEEHLQNEKTIETAANYAQRELEFSKEVLCHVIQLYPHLVHDLCIKFHDNGGISAFISPSQRKLAEKRALELREMQKILDNFKSNLTAFPYMAELIADYETYGIEKLAKSLEWGESQERVKKVASLRELRSATKQAIQSNLEAKYQLAYLLQLYPNLQDVLDTDFNELPQIDIENLSDYDRTRDWLSKEEYQSLNSVERNQLALDRYNDSHKKTKWQVGRDYELFVGYKYTIKGYDVDYFGSYMGLEDLGRDLIAKKDDTVLIIQCKYWSHEKQIHEKHITQLYGTIASYCVENSLNKKYVKGVLVTNIQLSEMAKKMAKFLKIEYVENFAKGNYPCIKCNIGRDGDKIYHLPFDQQYDTTKITSDGEFYAMTVQEAENAGFRRAFKWFKNQ